MTQPAHLSDEQMTRYRNREMTGVELLDLDSHLSTCADCRERLYKAGRSSAGMKELRSEFSEHLQYADIVACSEGSGKPLHVAHIRECAGCRAEVQDLSRFRTELADTPRRPVAMPKKPWVRYRIPLGIAAAVVVVAGGVTFALRRGGTPPAPAPATVEQAEASIPAPDREIFERAIASGRLDRAPILEGLVSRRGTLLGGPEGKRTIELLTPVGTAVLGDRPFLRWSGLETASSYVVAVFDEKFQKVAESPAIEGTDWQPAEPLPVGQVLRWQVTAKTKTGTVRAPAPPAPEARFRVLPPEVARHIDAIRREHPGNPLLLAALLAHEGALDDAQGMLDRVNRVTAQTYYESLRKLRTPE